MMWSNAAEADNMYTKRLHLLAPWTDQNTDRTARGPTNASNTNHF